MMPRLIHRIWLDDPMPDEFEAYGRDWERLHPGWELLEWRSTLELPPLRNHDLFDRAEELVPRDWKRFQADLLRLELLWLYGGVYADTDVQPLRPLDDLLHDVDCAVGVSPNPGPTGAHPVTNAVMAARPVHPFIAGCMMRLPGDVETYAGKHLAQVAGPWLLTRELTRAIKYAPDPGVYTSDAWGHRSVMVLGSSYFYPQSNAARDAGMRPELADAYCWHRWANTRDNRRGGVA